MDKAWRLLQGNKGRVLAAVVFVLAIAMNFWASKRQGSDFAPLHLAARGLAERAPIYEPAWLKTVFFDRYGMLAPSGVFYPPSTSVLMLPFGLSPYGLAEFAWFVTLVGAVILGVRAMLQLALPTAGRGAWVAAAAVILLSACIRWGITPLQGAPLVLGLLCLFLQAVERQRWLLAWSIATAVLAFKFTLALPFLGVLALHRRFASVALAVGVWVTLNVLGFAWLGGTTAFDLYRYNIGVVEALRDINTPDPWEPVSVPRLDWVYLLYGVGRNLALAKVLTALLSLMALIWVGVERLRLRRAPNLHETVAFLVPLVCLSLLSVYHHHYDAALFVAPLAMLVLLWRADAEDRGSSVLTRNGAALWMLAPLAVMMALLPIGKSQSILASLLGRYGLPALNFSFPIATTLAFIAGLIILRETVRAGQTAMPADPAE
ncbi:MAG: glycosyltransferase family 87 protein [Myxococcales bacterium]